MILLRFSLKWAIVQSCQLTGQCYHNARKMRAHMVKYATNFRNKHEEKTNLKIGIRQQVFIHQLLYHFIIDQMPIVFLLYCVLKCLLVSLNSWIIWISCTNYQSSPIVHSNWTHLHMINSQNCTMLCDIHISEMAGILLHSLIILQLSV